MRRALLAAVAATLLLTGTTMAASYAFTGKARWNDRLTGDFTTTVVGDITATATFDGHPEWVKLWMHNSSDDNIQCQQLNRPASTLTCTIVNAPAGTYRVEFWPSSSNVSATITVDTP